jgi:uncharacterized protein YbjT (DUF2867 family)
MAITYTSAGGQIKSDEDMLVAIDAAIQTLLTTGQGYTVFGSRTVTQGSLPELHRMRKMYENRILRRAGVTGVNYADMRSGAEGAETAADQGGF